MIARRMSVIIGLMACFAVDTSSLGAAEPASKARILMVTQSMGYRHRSVTRSGTELSAAEIAMTQLGQQTKLFEVHCTQDCAADFTRENLQNYDIVLFYTTGDLPIAEADLDYFLNDWLKQKGHGFIGIHSATDTYREHEPYWEMIGGTFDGHPWNSNNTVTVTVHDSQHPAMRPFGKEFEFTDEIYQYRNWQPEKVRVLMSLNMEKCNPKKPYHVAVAWAKDWGEGKVFVNNLGHNEMTWTNKSFLDSLEGAVKWVLGQEPGNAAPNPEVSQEEQAKAKAAAGS